MQKEKRRTDIIRTASVIAIAGNAALAAMKIIVGLSARSLAVVGDGIDSSTDVVISAMTLAVAAVISRPADEEHPWGHGRAETIATTILSFVLFFAGGQLVVNAIGGLLSGKPPAVPGSAALAATAASIVGKLLLAWSQYALGKKAESGMLIANAKNMRGDVFISSGVLVGLGLSIGLGIGAADAVVALLVGLWVLKSAVGIFMEANLELMDGSGDKERYQALFDAVRSVPGAGNPHRARMRRIAALWDIDLDIEVDPDLSVREAHDIAAAVELAIKDRVEGVFDIMVHVEPAGLGEAHREEGFGLREGTE